MSFSSQIKSELSLIDNINECCNHAQVYGLVLFAHYSGLDISFKTENPDVFNLYCKSIYRETGAEPRIITGKAKMMTAVIEGAEAKEKIRSCFGHSSKETSLRINYANFQNECCINSFLRGAFLACGSVSDPQKSYHLEFVVPHKKLSSDLIRLFNELDLSPKYIMRKGSHIVYFKDSESIEDFLAYIGAQNASLYLMNVKIEKDVKNQVNRKLNFEMYNLEKTVSASNRQIEAIEYIEKTSGLSILNDKAKLVAKLRKNNPEATLSELQKLTDNSISKSGIKHILDRITETADKMKNGV